MRGRKIDRIIEQLDETDRVDLIDALRSKMISDAVIARVIRRRGFDISESAIYHYRKNIHESQ